jgi:hypothetical protein
MERREFCEELLQTILKDEHIRLSENTPQKKEFYIRIYGKYI